MALESVGYANFGEAIRMTADVQDDDFDGFGTEAQLHFAAVVDGV